MPRVMGKASDIVVRSKLGRVASMLIFVGLFFTGMSGVLQLQKEWRLEWFIPADSYGQDYFRLNDKYFNAGQDFIIYATDVDFFEEQASFRELTDYIGIQNFIVQNVTQDWLADFRKVHPAIYTDKTVFWRDLKAWLSTTGAGELTNIKFKDADCNGVAGLTGASCDVDMGIAHSRCMFATMKSFEKGKDRYEAYRTMREDIQNMFGGSDKKVFPFVTEFLFWEENGIIDSELSRNLILAFAVIIMVISLLIPRPRIGCIVAINIVLAIVEVIGFAHYWGVTLNGISTIYFLICAGLAVDYSVHMGHTFSVAKGSAEERACEAMTRIGPSVFHAIFSTLLAVIVLAFTKSFVFEVFFKVLFLVSTVAGAHGLWCLPVVLSITGGSSVDSGEEKKTTTIP